MQVADVYKDYAKQQFKKHNTSVHLAILIKRGKVIAVATNSIGSRAKGSGYSMATIHAEKAVVKSLGDISQLRGASMVVVRLAKKDFEWVDSKPCHSCTKFLDKCIATYGMKKVYYSNMN
jgi:hypothetical protein